jgi:NADH-quinone oxidoreductase subunit L
MDDRISLLLVLVPALPLAATVVTAVLGARVLKQYSYLPVIVAVVASFLCSVILVTDVHHAQAPKYLARTAAAEPGYEHTVTLWRWASVGDAYDYQGEPPISSSDAGVRQFAVDVTLRADALTAVMLAMVTLISSLVAIYSVGYMQGDRGLWRFFAYIGLFVFSMTMLVSVSNFVLLYVFWEAVGVCSYLLIGYWYAKPEAASAGKKAFLVNRIGDFGFALAIFLIWTTYGTLNFHDSAAPAKPTNSLEGAAASDGAVAEPQMVRGVLGETRIADDSGYVGGGVGLAICLLLLMGACGKSAQFPLHVWLPDAVEGPTPVSALIHAVTMVTAGVYMVARCAPLFVVSPLAQLVVACIGGFTALLAAAIALTEFDLKRVLAYSTISQLGYMFLGLGAGTFAGITAGMFHLFTHAFFKALLFLGAGSVMHAMGNVFDMRQFGGLRHRLPVTHLTFLIGCLALAGVPPLAGFWSKGAILASVEEKSHELAHHAEPASAHASHAADAEASHSGHDSTYAVIYRVLYHAATFTAFLTAVYTFRAFYLTFYGVEKVPHAAGDHAHESPSVMTWPLIALAVGAGIAGLSLNHVFAEYLGHVPSLAGGAVAATRVPHVFHGAVALSSSAVALGGVLVATYLYLGGLSEVRRIRAWLDFQGLSRWLDTETVARVTKQPVVAAIHNFAVKLRLGWLTSAVGYLLLLVTMVLTAPLLIGKFFTPYRLSSSKFYFDELYVLAVVRPLRFLADLCYAVDQWLIDGLVNALGRIPPAVGSLMRSLQIGLVQFYALAMVLGALVLIATKLLWGIG